MLMRLMACLAGRRRSRIDLCPKIHVTPHRHGHNSRAMRLLLVILALVSLLMTPVAASASAAECLGHGGGMVMSSDAPKAHHTEHAVDHSCCNEDGTPAEHDSETCAQACAAVCVANVALADAGIDTPTLVSRILVETVPLKAFHAHAPPGLKRPPRTVA